MAVGRNISTILHHIFINGFNTIEWSRLCYPNLIFTAFYPLWYEHFSSSTNYCWLKFLLSPLTKKRFLRSNILKILTKTDVNIAQKPFKKNIKHSLNDDYFDESLKEECSLTKSFQNNLIVDYDFEWNLPLFVTIKIFVCITKAENLFKR